MVGIVSTIQRRADRARSLSDALMRSVGDEFRHARIQAGLSQEATAAAAGISRSELGRLERARAPWLTLDVVCRVAVVLGLAPSLRLYPADSPMRDAASIRVLGALRAELHPTLRWATEVVLAGGRDRRAWDAVITGPGWRLVVECETRLFDVQALERRVALKRRDDGDPNVVLLVPRTRGNYAALAAAETRLRSAFPLDTRLVLGALRDGRDPGGSGIVLL
jgi:transcriptional regulator with XRE-family HTH domain